MDNNTNYIREPRQTEIGPEIEITCCSNVYIRRMIFKQAGITELGHTHRYDHLSYLSSGSVEMQIYDQEKDEMTPPKVYKAPATIFVAKELVHQITSLEDNTVVSCIHALRDIEEEIISPDMYPGPTALYDVVTTYKERAEKDLITPVIADSFTDIRFQRPFDAKKSF